MKTYGQFCPLAQAAQLLCERWTLIVIRELVAGSTRFGELQKGVPLMSPSLLSTRLKQLIEEGLVERQGSGRNTSYILTTAGLELRPLVEQMGAWGHRWARSNLQKEDLDAGLLMWDMRRSVNPAAFPKQRIVVKFHYPDASEGVKEWWLVSGEDEIDLCLEDPQFEIDIVVECSLEAMTRVWTCQQKFNEAVKQGHIRVFGNPVLTRRLQDWLQASLLSQLGASKESGIRN